MNLEEYLQQLSDPANGLKVSGLVRLSALTPEEAQTFGALWSTLDVRRRRQVMRGLVELAEDDVDLNFDCAFLRVLEDDDAEVQLEAVRGLWEYERPNLIAPLLRITEGDQDARVRAEAALALGRFVLLAEHGKLRAQHFREVEAALRRKLQDANEMEEVRGRALEAMGPHDGVWVRQAIREAYESGAHGLKVSAVHAMGRSCQGRWLGLLLRELSNEDPEVRFEAALACGSLGNEKAIPHLAPLLADPDEEVKEATIAALGEIGGREAKDLLLGLAGDPSPSVREAARDALAEIDFDENPLSFKHRF